MTRALTIIALTGPAGSGKDTVADLLVTHANFTKYAFADVLRREVNEAFGTDPRRLTDRASKETPTASFALSRCLDTAFARTVLVALGDNTQRALDMPRSPRQILQWWGTEYRRASDPDYWLTQLRRRINYASDFQSVDRFVITDVRFANEATLCKTATSRHQIWQVTRPGAGIPPGAHRSEVTGAAFLPHAIINNAHDVRHLQHVVMAQWWAYSAGFKSVKVEIEA